MRSLIINLGTAIASRVNIDQLAHQLENEIANEQAQIIETQ